MEIKYGIKEIHEKIISALRRRGPSLPIQMGKELNMSSLFVSAFLSELVDEKKIKISSLKVGGSPLYFLEGQEEKLENFYNYLHPKEIEALQLLKKDKILKDSEQEPSIRVALRAIKDFAIGFMFNKEIYWRYMLVSLSEIDGLIKARKYIVRPLSKSSPMVSRTPEIPIVSIAKIEKKEKIKVPKSMVDTSKVRTDLLRSVAQTTKPIKINKPLAQTTHEANPLIIPKTKKQKSKSEFVLNVINLLNKNNFNIIEEKDYKEKEYNCVLQIKSELGPINFLTQAKHKKTITENDLKKLLSSAQLMHLPALILYIGEIGKKAEEFLEKYKSVLKARRIE
ncbi:MAG: hypothetical protein AABW90_01825 [Nanoarchaeota archaeon]